MAKGRIDVNGKTFNTGDAARIRDGGKLSFTNGDNAEILILICVRKKFQPCHNQQKHLRNIRRCFLCLLKEKL